MKFTWDEAKRLSNLRKHGLDFSDAQKVFTGETITYLDGRVEYGEDRWITFGLLQGSVVAIAHTERYNKIRIISFRKASKYEQTLYFYNLTN